jgi:4-alpha-glucanotransferase
MRFPRAGGILVHPTSFPSPYGIGDLGPGAFEFINFLVRSQQSIWQILPLGPTGYGDSPYQSFSAFAGNPLLISPEHLQRDGYLPSPLPIKTPAFPADKVDFGWVIDWKGKLFEIAFERFLATPPAGKTAAFETFMEQQAAWLDDFALFMALKAHHKDFEGGVWNTWPADIAQREPAAVKRWMSKLENEIQLEKFKQFLFFEQWLAVKEYANERNIRIVGDVPIFVAYDSADVWANPDIFYLDDKGAPTVIAGVPPDYFSATGQRWGNPLYRWAELARNDYVWWVDRLNMTFTQVDMVRIDHFRGFDAYWEIPAEEPTAVVGRWVKGPGPVFFEAMRQQLGELPIIAEDLGVITPAVVALRDQFAFPGMKILQFAFGGERNSDFLPHNFGRNCVVYTGTHDNETTLGWYRNASADEQDHVRRYVARDGSDIAWDMIRLAYASVADTAVAPIQDLMSLDNSARMNFPGRTGGWWTWRYRAGMLTDLLADRLAELTHLFGRAPQPDQDDESPRYEIEIEDA